MTIEHDLQDLADAEQHIDQLAGHAEEPGIFEEEENYILIKEYLQHKLGELGVGNG